MAKHIRDFRTKRDTHIKIERWIEPRTDPATPEWIARMGRHLIDQTGVVVTTPELALGITLTEQDLIALRDHLTAIIEADQP